MTNRERILLLLSGHTPDRVPWFCDMDYWYHAAKKRGLLPTIYDGDGYFKLCRDLKAGFYLQGYSPFIQINNHATFSVHKAGYQQITTMHTEKGDLTQIMQYLPASCSDGFVKHFVETPEDLPAFRRYVEGMRFKPAYDEARRRKDIIADNGVVLCYTPRSPFMQMVTEYIGIAHLSYLLMDESDEMNEILELMESKYDIAAEIAVDAPAECIMIPENLSSEVVGERYYKQYLRGYEARWAKSIAQAGKYSFIHMDGRLKGLLKLVAETGIRVIEAITPAQSGDLTMDQIMTETDPYPGTIVWGGLPGAFFTPCISEEDFIDHVIQVLGIMRQRPGYVLGAADQVPPDGLLRRVGIVADMCEMYGRY